MQQLNEKYSVGLSTAAAKPFDWKPAGRMMWKWPSYTLHTAQTAHVTEEMDK